MSEDRVSEALAYAEKKHKGQFRVGGLPYITHPVAVCEMMKQKGYPEEYQITALFHDLLEDTDASCEEIERIGGKKVLEAVILLTKTEGYDMAEYMQGIKSNAIAKVVKVADRIHNLKSAIAQDDDFKRRYIKESLEWFCDIDDEILPAVKELEKSLAADQ